MSSLNVLKNRRTWALWLGLILSLGLLAMTYESAFATHSVAATPGGGTFDSPQAVALSSSDPSAVIFFTLDGTDPTIASTIYNGTEINFSTNTTLKFVATLVVDNHTSPVITENYFIVSSPPVVESTEPSDNARRVDRSAIINATFSKGMDESTIDSQSFVITSESLEEPVSGEISYDSSANTASFIPDTTLDPGLVYGVTLTDDIKDAEGNSLEQFAWSFTTGGQIEIQIRDVETFDPIGGSAFTITPDPFLLEESRTVEDNGPFDSDFLFFGIPVEGAIFLENVENNFTTYLISETTLPSGYSPIYGDVIVTVTQNNHCDFCGGRGFVLIQNIASSSSISDVEGTIEVPRPYLNRTQFELYEDNAITGIFSGVQGQILETAGPVQSPNSSELPPAILATNEDTVNSLPDVESLNFLLTASPTSSGTEIIDSFDIPTYPGPDGSIASDVIYVVPAYVIPYEGSKNNFVLTPIIDEVFAGLQVFVKQASFVQTEVAKIERINMTFAVDGNDIGFIFGISDDPPPGTPEPPLDAPALFLDIGFVGDVDFSNQDSFEGSPKIDILVNKTLPGFPELPNGCPDFRLLFFNGTGWEEVQKLNPTGNFTDFCPFTLEPEHFSKFAVGGVKGQTISTEEPPSDEDSPEETRDEERRGGGGGGGSRSTGVTSTPSGNDIETTATTGAGTVTLQFESVEEGSGQVRVDTNRLSVFEDIFDDIGIMPQDNDEHGIVHTNGISYATTGDIFDIDASSVTFQGMVDVTIPYDDDAVTLLSGSESGVRFLHYDEEDGWQDSTSSVNELANTVTGTVDSLSPVIAAVIISDGGLTSPTYQLEITNPAVTISEGRMALHADLKNLQGINQDYVLVIQVLDQSNIVHHIEWQERSVSTSEGEVSISWEGLGKGSYTVEIFALTEIENPSLLAPRAQTEIDI